MLNISPAYAHMRITEEVMMQTVLAESKRKPVRIFARKDDRHSDKYVSVYGGTKTGAIEMVGDVECFEVVFGG